MGVNSRSLSSTVTLSPGAAEGEHGERERRESAGVEIRREDRGEEEGEECVAYLLALWISD